MSAQNYVNSLRLGFQSKQALALGNLEKSLQEGDLDLAEDSIIELARAESALAVMDKYISVGGSNEQ